MTQPSLFDAGVRRSDPVTSQQAAQSLTQPALSEQRLKVLREVSLNSWGRTAYEVHLATGYQQNVCSKRLLDLVRLGYVEATDLTRPGSSLRLLTVYRITDAGREAIT